jgi:hypothetical protein
MTPSRFHHAVGLAAAVAALGFASSAAHATFGLEATPYTTGSFIPTDPELSVNTGFGTITVLPDGSKINHMGCIASTPGGVGCTTSGLPIVVDTWYKRPDQPTRAAAQVFADYGVLKARTWGTAGETGDISPGEPLGRRSFFARATAEWRDDLIYTGAAPTWVTMAFTLHSTWQNLGRFAFTVGRERIGAENERFIEGQSYINCAGTIECQSNDYTQTVQVLGDDAANTSGNVTLAINFSFLLRPQVVDPEDPTAALPFAFVANLVTWTLAPGSETDAFNTATLDRILIQPGAEIGFASGHSWPVQVVPEPATWALWGAGLLVAVVATVRRRA